MEISPKYCIHLAQEVAKKIWEEFSSYDNVYGYIQRWHEVYDYDENFGIVYKDYERKQIDLLATLHNVDGELLLKMAVDMGVETPDYIPSIPTFRNEIKQQYNNASEVFEKAIKNVETDPDLAIGFANSALESIVKDIASKENLEDFNPSASLTKQVNSLFRAFRDKQGADIPNEIMTIASSLLNASKSIEDIRSTKTYFHGKTSEERVISDPLFAYFIVNATATIGLFLLNYYKKAPKETLPPPFPGYYDLPF